MIHHQGNIFLCQVIEAASLRQDAPYQFMVHFTGPFLIRSTWITIEYIRSSSGNGLPLLDCFRIRKFTSIVCQDNREQTVKCFASQGLVQQVYNLYYRS